MVVVGESGVDDEEQQREGWGRKGISVRAGKGVPIGINGSGWE